MCLDPRQILGKCCHNENVLLTADKETSQYRWYN